MRICASFNACCAFVLLALPFQIKEKKLNCFSTNISLDKQNRQHRFLFIVADLNNLPLDVKRSKYSVCYLVSANSHVVHVCFNRTIGEMLAKFLNCRFLDADDFHPESNKGRIIEWIAML